MIIEYSSILLTGIVLFSASVSDIRTRTVSDIHWVIVGSMGMLFMMVRSDDVFPAVLTAAGMLLTMVYLFIDSGRVLDILAMSSAVVMFAASYAVSEDVRSIITAVNVTCLLLMYRSGLIRGGADVKALVTMSFIFPVYTVNDVFPILWGPVYPQACILNPIFSTLMIALILSFLYLPFTYRGCGFTERRMPISEAESSFVWPVEDIIEGRKVRVRIHDDAECIYERLRDHGCTDVAVTPMIPFIPFISISFIIVTIMGSPLMAFLQ